jgi:glyoxylase-like metal-dependent hydrolase (beta-lactamase superfamily II)
LLDLVESDGMTVTGVLATHFHADHIGGSMMGHQVEGVATLLERCSCPVHVQRDEVPWVTRTSGLGVDQLVAHEGGDVLAVGDLEITLVHTPGHTPGSQCFHIGGRLVSGDTLFLDGCGRTDLQGGDPDEMYYSLTQRLAAVPDDTVLYPGHQYSPEAFATMGETRSRNYVFRLPTIEQWRTMFGA